MNCVKCGKPFSFRYKISVGSISPVDAETEPQAATTDSSFQFGAAMLQGLDDRQLEQLGLAVTDVKFLRNQKATQGKPDTSDLFRSMRRTECFTCPNCGVPLQIMLDVNIVGVVEGEGKPKTSGGHRMESDWNSDGLMDEEIAIIDRCRGCGVLSAFWEALQDEKGATNQMPKRPERFFLTFLRQAVRYYPRHGGVRQYFQSLYPGAKIEFWSAQSIVVVTISGVLHRFIPTRVLMTGRTRTLASSLGAATPHFNDWAKTPHGYVPAESRLFLAELTSQCRGLRPGHRESPDVPLSDGASTN